MLTKTKNISENNVYSINTPEYFEISIVPPEMLSSCWEQCTKYLQKATVRSHGRWTLENLRQKITNNQQHLWISFVPESFTIIGCATTSFVDYPNNRMLSIEFLGGENMESWVWEGIEKMEEWAKDNGCIGIEAIGRKGFWHWLKDKGFDKSYTVFEKRFNYE
tara:strand:- start:1246 stop:1734 length:489 start_codon:yes stop_codon:yes gene_type:complete